MANNTISLDPIGVLPGLLEINETSVVYRDNINTIKINRVNLEYYHAVLGLTETMKGTCEVMEKKF